MLIHKCCRLVRRNITDACDEIARPSPTNKFELLSERMRGELDEAVYRTRSRINGTVP